MNRGFILEIFFSLKKKSQEVFGDRLQESGFQSLGYVNLVLNSLYRVKKRAESLVFSIVECSTQAHVVCFLEVTKFLLDSRVEVE